VLTGGLSIDIANDFRRILGDKEPSSNVISSDDPCTDVAAGGKTYGALLHAKEQFWAPPSHEYPFAQVNVTKLWPDLYYL